MIENDTAKITPTYDFEDIRPYNDAEVRPRLQQLINDPLCLQLMQYLRPEVNLQHLSNKAEKVHSTMDFQLEFMNDAIHRILELSSAGYSSSGFEQLQQGNSHLFVANHRDIFLDAAILQIELVKHGFPTTEISFGSNLSEEGFITTFAKLNRMFPIVREGSSKELYEFSGKLSAYIRHKIRNESTSVWIAQRNGRTKDGNDQTQAGLLKMLKKSGSEDFIENFSELSIVPVSISYEYEPCDFLKAREIYLAGTPEGYSKAEGEDLNSIVIGLRQQKGRIHIALGRALEKNVLQASAQIPNINDKLRYLATYIDNEIHKHYCLFPTNYIAADLLNDTDVYRQHYTEADKLSFRNYCSKGLSKLGIESPELERIFLRIYANPVLNRPQAL